MFKRATEENMKTVSLESSWESKLLVKNETFFLPQTVKSSNKLVGQKWFCSFRSAQIMYR